MAAAARRVRLPQALGRAPRLGPPEPRLRPSHSCPLPVRDAQDGPRRGGCGLMGEQGLGDDGPAPVGWAARTGQHGSASRRHRSGRWRRRCVRDDSGPTCTVTSPTTTGRWVTPSLDKTPYPQRVARPEADQHDDVGQGTQVGPGTQPGSHPAQRVREGAARRGVRREAVVLQEESTVGKENILIFNFLNNVSQIDGRAIFSFVWINDSVTLLIDPKISISPS